MGFFLGIDGGGSRTTCCLGDQTSLLGTGNGGASNIVRVGERKARESISKAVLQACDKGNIRPDQIQRTCIGVAGAARAETAEAIRRILADLVRGEIVVVGDMVIALETAWGTGPGIIVIAGTGSIAYGRNCSERIARVGGWGHAVSDEGSGHWIGRTALAAVLREQHNTAHSPLLERFMTAWDVRGRDELILAANETPARNFAALFPSVLLSADDPIARAVLTQAGIELAVLAKIVIARLSDKEATRVAMVGGVFRNSEVVREVFYNQLRSEFPEIFVNPEVLDPVKGALELARR